MTTIAYTANLEIWNPTVYYQVGDLVYDSGGDIYQCLTANFNDNPPSANWQLLSTQGPQGPPGPAGPQGPPGPAGSQNYALLISDFFTNVVQTFTTNFVGLTTGLNIFGIQFTATSTSDFPNKHYIRIEIRDTATNNLIVSNGLYALEIPSNPADTNGAYLMLPFFSNGDPITLSMVVDENSGGGASPVLLGFDIYNISP